MIEYFNFHQNKFMKSNMTLQQLVNNKKSLGYDGIIIKTNASSFEYEYFMMIDKFGHYEWFRMDEIEFLEQWRELK